jgi:protein-tyrosine-phosphatase
MKNDNLDFGFPIRHKDTNSDIPAVTSETNSVYTDTYRIRILFICGSDTCRAPMARVILEQKLKELGRLEEYEIDSAAVSNVPGLRASDGSREAMVALFGNDLLASHLSKTITPELIEKADLVLVMSPSMKEGLPVDKTFTLKEYIEDTGAIAEPDADDFRGYIYTANDISYTLDLAMLRILALQPRQSLV